MTRNNITIKFAMSTFDQKLLDRLTAQQNAQLYRHYSTRSNACAARANYDQNEYLAFISNDYLGLANHPDLISAVQKATSTYGVGSGASHAVSGHCNVHEELEQALATFTNRPAALVFSSGYMANLGIISALLNEKDSVFADRLVHASLIDGVRLSGARLVRYQHNNATNLKNKLPRYQQGQALIISDGVFSMDGDIAPIPELAQLAEEHNAALLIDDAHGFGVLGKNGAGSCEYYNLNNNAVPILMGTLSKAFGCFGAFVVGSKPLIDTLRQFCRTYMYTTALPPLLAQASLVSLELVKKETWRREHLQQLITYFQQRANELQLPIMPSLTAIQPLLVGDNQRVIQLQEALKQRGFLVGAIRPPTVPVNTARLRVSLNVLHTQNDIDNLLTALADCWKYTYNV
jgi:8-amino-7-oxononanoate synthase